MAYHFIPKNTYKALHVSLRVKNWSKPVESTGPEFCMECGTVVEEGWSFCIKCLDDDGEPQKH